MRVLIVGGGGREHALAWKLAQSPLLTGIYCAPGNAGIATVAECVPLQAEDAADLKEWALAHKIDLTVVGPEAPLAAGLADHFRAAGLKVFGPGSAGARLEGSKAWAKEQMSRWGIPTAGFAVFDRYEPARRHIDTLPEGPVVVKADGLAAGKGVTVARTRGEAEEALRKIMVEGVFGAAGGRVVIEDCLTGEEVSVLAVTDGKELLVLPSAQDHKAIGEGDTGPNTGGMGAYSPAPALTARLSHAAVETVFRPLLAGLNAQGVDYRGVIYAGLMVSGNRISVLEFNVRFGDPETQAILPRLEADLLPPLLAAAEGRLAGSGLELRASAAAAACVVIASPGYPGPYPTGQAISGLDRIEEFAGADEGLAVFHAGTAVQNGAIVTAGGRVLGVTAWAKELPAALATAYRAADQISFPGCYFRRDIAHRALGRKEES